MRGDDHLERIYLAHEPPLGALAESFGVSAASGFVAGMNIENVAEQLVGQISNLSNADEK